MSPRISFEKDLTLLDENVAEMGKKALENYEALFVAFEKGDKEEIHRITKIDKEIGNRQREIESQCLFLITKQQPIVGDLRVVTAALKVVTDIERVGDHVADIAELLLRIGIKDLTQYSIHIVPMLMAAKDMTKMAVDAFTGRDRELAEEVIASDDVVDELFNNVKSDLIELLKRDAKDADDCIDVLMIAKYLEKIGDHAVNIGQWEVFKETGNMDNMRLL